MKLGEIQKLKIEKKVEFGVYLSDGEERVLLPKKQVPEDASVGDEIAVFVYKDSKDRLIATTVFPQETSPWTSADVCLLRIFSFILLITCC